ncbi:MAG: phosphoribosyltransferase family protein [Bacteroidia bacterium]
MVKVLSQEEVALKLKRIGMQIREAYASPTWHLIGIAPRGVHVATLLHRAIGGTLHTYDTTGVYPPLSETDTHWILVDDVLYTGRTLMNALQSLYRPWVETIQVAVLVDRGHRKFPITPMYVGLRLATTLQEYVHVAIEGEQIEVYLT